MKRRPKGEHMDKRRKRKTPGLIVPIALAFLAGGATMAVAYDPSQSTGTGTQQGENAETSAMPGGATDSKSGRNEDSGSAVGTPRQSSKSGMESGQSHGSRRPGSTGSDAGTDETNAAGRPMGKSGAGTTKGAAKK